MRSVNYPVLSLPEAIDLTKQIWDKKKRSVITEDEAVGVFGHKNAKSGPARRKLSALRQYGLVDKHSGGLRLSDRAVAILLKPEQSPSYIKAINEAVADVPMFQDLLKTHSSSSAEVLKSYLIVDKDFTDTGANSLVKSFLPTKRMAVLENSVDGAIGQDDEKVPARVFKGSLVQWTSQGVDMFESPRRVQSISGDGTFAFVEGTSTGIDVGQLQVVDALSETTPPETDPPKPPPNPFAKPLPWERDQTALGMNEDTSTIGEGVARFSWPERLTAEQFEDLEYWVHGVLRKAKRSISADSEVSGGDEDN